MAPQSYKDIFTERDTELTEGANELRQQFFDWYDENSNEYDEEDVKQLRENDYYRRRFVVHNAGVHQNGEKGAFDMVKTVFKWRKDNKINDLKDSDFPEEFFTSGEIFPYRKDKEGNVTILLRLCKHFKDSKTKEIFRKFIINILEKIEKKYDRRKHVTIIIDCKNVGFRNIDLDLAFYAQTLLLKHYPLVLAYVLVVNMHWILSAAWKIVKSWLPQLAVERIIFVDDKTINDYIENEDLPEDLGGLDKTEYPLEDPISHLPESLLRDIQTMTVATQ